MITSSKLTSMTRRGKKRKREIEKSFFSIYDKECQSIASVCSQENLHKILWVKQNFHRFKYHLIRILSFRGSKNQHFSLVQT